MQTHFPFQNLKCPIHPFLDFYLLCIDGFRSADDTVFRMIFPNGKKWFACYFPSLWLTNIGRRMVMTFVVPTQSYLAQNVRVEVNLINRPRSRITGCNLQLQKRKWTSKGLRPKGALCDPGLTGPQTLMVADSCCGLLSGLVWTLGFLGYMIGGLAAGFTFKRFWKISFCFVELLILQVSTCFQCHLFLCPKGCLKDLIIVFFTLGVFEKKFKNVRIFSRV